MYTVNLMRSVPNGEGVNPFARYFNLKFLLLRSVSKASSQQSDKEWMPGSAASPANKVGRPIFASTMENGPVSRNQGHHVGAGPQCSLSIPIQAQDTGKLEKFKERPSEYFDTTWGELEANLITTPWHHGLFYNFRGHDENTISNQINLLAIH